MLNRISFKLALTVLVVAVVAAIPLSMYILLKQEKEKIESTIAIGRGNTKLLGKTMLDVFLKSGGEPNSMRIDAEEAMNTYKDQFELGLVFGQTLMLSKKHRGLIMATLDKNTLGKKIEPGKDKPAATTHKEDEINNFLKYEENHSGPCFNNPAQKCYNFSFVAKYEKTPVILSVLSISENHVLDPIKKKTASANLHQRRRSRCACSAARRRSLTLHYGAYHVARRRGQKVFQGRSRL